MFYGPLFCGKYIFKKGNFSFLCDIRLFQHSLHQLNFSEYFSRKSPILPTRPEISGGEERDTFEKVQDSSGGVGLILAVLLTSLLFQLCSGLQGDPCRHAAAAYPRKL